MTKTDTGFECVAIKENKPFSHQTVEKHMKDKTKLVSAFHVISEKKLINPTLKLDYDIFVAGDNKDSVCLLYTSPSPRDLSTSRMPSSA